MKNILITGATGFVGADILKKVLANDPDNTAHLIVRGTKNVSAKERIKESNRIKVLEGDVAEDNLGLGEREIKRLAETIDEIYHCAAITDFGYPIDEIRKVNVKGTENILSLALKGLEINRPKKVFHISTAYVVGTRKCVFGERDLDIGQGFNNTYEQSKYEAELLVSEYVKRGVDVTVFRPSILTGDTKTGSTSNFKMFYKPLHFLAEELFEAIPANANTSINLVPVDEVSEAIYLIANDDEADKRIYHIVHPNEVNMGYFINSASDFFGFRKPELIPSKDFDMGSLTPVQKKIIEPYSPYFNYETKFESANARKTLRKYGFTFPDYDKDLLDKIFGYCVKAGFIKPKKRVFVA